MARQTVDNTRGADESQQQADQLVLEGQMRRIGRKLLVLSGKGGVGKSTVAANLAFALARAGSTVGLLDVDVHGPSIPKLLGLQGRRPPTSPEGRIEPIALSENLAVMSIGFLLAGDDDPVIWRGPMKYGVIRQFLKDVDWGDLDYLVVDSPPGTGDEPLAVAQLVGSDAGAIIVTTPQELAIADVRRCVSFCRRLSVPIAGIVENMSTLLCPHCGEPIDLFKADGGKKLAEQISVPFLGRIPIDPEVVRGGDAGEPFVRGAADGPAAKAFANIVAGILHTSDEPQSPATMQKETHQMKIAIPVAAGRLAMHFGHCEQFALFNADTDAKKVTGSDMLTPPAHEPGVLPAWLHEQGATVIITGGMGTRAQQLFAQNDITVVIGAPADEPEAIATAYLEGKLKAGENICDH